MAGTDRMTIEEVVKRVLLDEHADVIRGDAVHRADDEWLVGRGYLSAESISLCLAGPADHINNENQGGNGSTAGGLSSHQPHRRGSRSAPAVRGADVDRPGRKPAGMPSSGSTPPASAQ